MDTNLLVSLIQTLNILLTRYSHRVYQVGLSRQVYFFNSIYTVKGIGAGEIQRDDFYRVDIDQDLSNHYISSHFFFLSYLLYVHFLLNIYF